MKKNLLKDEPFIKLWFSLIF